MIRYRGMLPPNPRNRTMVPGAVRQTAAYPPSADKLNGPSYLTTVRAITKTFGKFTITGNLIGKMFCDLPKLRSEF